MLRDALLRVSGEFYAARSEALTGHPLAAFIRDNLPTEVSAALGELSQDLIVNAGHGRGNWAYVPWVAVFNPLVTDTATRGYYVVYLFAFGRNEIYLSLNQGTTAIMQEFGRRGYAVLRNRAGLIRARLPEYREQFDVYDVDLGAKGYLPRGYEAGHAFGRRYQLDTMPSEEELRADLKLIIQAYFTLTFRGGLDPSPEQDANIESGDDVLSSTVSLLEIRQYQMHKRIERHPRASREAKRYHGTRCQGCGLRFEERYGELGIGFVEVHHLKPLCQLQEGVPIHYNIATDFAVLCSNCHRMIHRTSDPSNLAAFRLHVRS